MIINAHAHLVAPPALYSQILTAAALTEHHPVPTHADADLSMTNICRCGCYPRVRSAIKTAAATIKHGAVA
jgi:isoquinoline 1-oxidoreductase subunit alpha